MSTTDWDDIKHRCSLCEKEITYRDLWDKNTKGFESIRMRLCLCTQCYYTFKGDRVSVTPKPGDGVKDYRNNLRFTDEEKCLLHDMLVHEMQRISEYIIKEWAESYHVTDHYGMSSRVQKFNPQDMVAEQHQLLKLIELFKRIMSSRKK